MLHNLVPLLSWSGLETATLLRPVRDGDDAALRTLTEFPGYYSAALADLLRTLPPETIARVSQAPEMRLRATHSALSWEDRQRFAVAALRHEKDRLCGTLSPGRLEWSALGDHHLPPGAICGIQVPPMRPLGIPLDLACPRSGVHVPWSSPQQTPLPGAAVQDAVRLMETATQGLVAVSPAAGEFLQATIDVVVVRIDTVEPHMLGSSTLLGRPGEVGICNVHLPNIRVARVANALLHEGIHCLLYHVHRHRPFLPDADGSRGCTATSPWTGRELPISSWVQAHFVWFGLLRFWHRALSEDVGGFDRPDAVSSMAQARTGFVRRPAALPAQVRGATAWVLDELIQEARSDLTPATTQ